MFKKMISVVLALSVMCTLVPVYSEDLTQINEKRSETSYRMQPLLNKYNNLTSDDIKAQEDKYIDIEDHFGKDFITKLAAIDVIAGYGNGKFGPNDTLLACQYIKMVVMALGFTPEQTGANWWDVYIDIAIEQRIIKAGEIADYTQPLTRELAGVIGFRALMKYVAQPTGDDVWFDYNVSKISDYALISDQYKNDVVMAYRMGIIQGSNNLYVPKDTLTRAQGAVIVNKLIDNKLRVESIPKPDEILTYTIRDLNEANFNFIVQPGKTFKIYPGYFPLNEIYTVFKAMQDNLDVGGGYREIDYTGLKDNFCTSMYQSKQDADYFFIVDNNMPTKFASFTVYLEKCYIPNELNDKVSGFLYSINTQDPENYNKYMKDYAYKILEVLFESDANEVIKLHDYYLSLALNGKPGESEIYFYNNRLVSFTAGGTNGGGMRMEVHAKGAIDDYIVNK